VVVKWFENTAAAAFALLYFTRRSNWFSSPMIFLCLGSFLYALISRLWKSPLSFVVVVPSYEWQCLSLEVIGQQSMACLFDWIIFLGLPQNPLKCIDLDSVEPHRFFTFWVVLDMNNLV
jgi:hypothetical protein